MSAIDDVGRMLTLIPWLLERPGASLAETAEAFGVDERTVRQDLQRLDFCGLPGLGGGDLFEVTLVGDRILVRMADELKRPLRLTPREALRLVLSLEAVAAAFDDDLPALRSALAKVRAAAGIEEGVAVELDPEGGRWLPPLRRAVTEGLRVRLCYRGRTDDAPRERRVDPWSLRIVDGAWYLQGHDDDADDLRTFRLDRVVDVEVTDEPRSALPPEEPLPRPRYVPPDDAIDVELLVEPHGRWLLDAIEPDVIVEEPGGRCRVRLTTDALDWIQRLLLAAGGGVGVLSPEQLRTRVLAAAGGALEAYADA